jgi:hypothetical protein
VPITLLPPAGDVAIFSRQVRLRTYLTYLEEFAKRGIPERNAAILVAHGSIETRYGSPKSRAVRKRRMVCPPWGV